MKRLLVIFLFLLSIQQFPQQQDKFIIGVDWINPTWPHPGQYSNYVPLHDNYWNFLKSFGVNFGALNISRHQPDGTGLTDIYTELDQAASRNISIFLWTYQLYGTHGRRWMYQVEGTLDFGSHSSGESDYQLPVNGIPEPHWSQVIVNPNANNFWKLEEGTHQAGYVAEDLINDSEIPNDDDYYARLMIRKTSIINDGTPVVRVIIINKDNGNTVNEQLILANELNRNEWTDYELFCFRKKITAPYDCTGGPENIILNDSLGITGVEDYILSTQVFTPYEIKIEWFGDVSCDIDYLTIEDARSNRLHNGDYDYIFNQIVAEFGTYDGLGKLKVWDEPYKENLLPIREMKRIIDEYLPGGYEDRSALSFHVPPYTSNPNWSSPQQYFAQTNIDILLSDPYPIPLYTDETHTELFVVPTSPDYNEKLQERLNSHLTFWLQDEIYRSVLFDKPFWFTPQAHSWLESHREPSAYEIKAITNLGICYGAKGIHYFMYSRPTSDGIFYAGVTLLDSDDINDPLPRLEDYYLYPKWETVKQLNQKLAAIGDELISLTWQQAFYIAAGQPIGSYVTNVQSYYTPIEGPSIPDPSTEIYTQLGIFKWTDEPNNKNLEHFFVVNRRTLQDEGLRDIEVQFDKSSTNPDNWQNWVIREVGTENYWIDGESGEFRTGYTEGEGKLFRLEPVVMGGGNLIYNETIERNIELNGELIIESGVTLTVNADYDCYGNITIKDGGKLKTTGNGKINFHNHTRIITEGIVIINGEPTNKLELDFIEPHHMNGINVENGATLVIYDCIIKNSRNGITVKSGASWIEVGEVDFENCSDNCINITGPNSSTSTIHDNTFLNSNAAISAVNLSEIYIAENVIQNTDVGIYLSNVTNPLIINNTLTSTHNAMPGIFLESCNGIIRGNTINGHTNGIQLGNSSPDIGDNEITDNLYHGIYVGFGSLPNMEARLYSNPPEYYAISGYNDIFENGGTTTGGPIDNDGSEIFFSNSNALMREGCNSIYDDRSGGEHPFRTTKLLMNGFGFTRIEVYAELNYWSNNPLYPLEERFGNLTVHYVPFWTEPCEIPEGSGGGEELFVKSSSGEIMDTLYPVQRTIGTLSNTDLLYASAEEKFITADYDGAEELYNQIVNGSDSLKIKLQAYRRLYEIGKLNSKPTSYFSTLYNEYSSLSQSTEDSLLVKIFTQLSSLSLIGEEEIIPAVEEFDNVIQQNPGNEEAIYAEIDALTAALLIENGDSTLGKSAAANYIVENNEYNNRIINILRKNFGAESDEKEKDLLPTEYTLYQNYPNPFNPVTTIKYDLPNAGNVELEVYDILGRRVKTLVSQTQQAGSYEISFDAGEFASGIYIYQLKADDFVNSKKMILLK